MSHIKAKNKQHSFTFFFLLGKKVNKEFLSSKLLSGNQRISSDLSSLSGTSTFVDLYNEN